MIRRLALALVAAALLAVTARADDPARSTVYDLIASRLALMQPVAAWKHAKGAPVENLDREATVLEKSAEDAGAAGLDPQTVRPFFQAQIDAAKVIQHCWIARWQAGNAAPMTDPPDLATEIRPRLITIGTAILQSIQVALATGVNFDPDHVAGFAEAVDLDCLDGEARDAILLGLGGIRLPR